MAPAWERGATVGDETVDTRAGCECDVLCDVVHVQELGMYVCVPVCVAAVA